MDDLFEFLRRAWPVTLALVVIAVLALWHLVWKVRVTTAGRPWQWLRARLGWGLKPAELARRLGIDLDQLRAWQPEYRERLIAKKSGGTRRLLIPDRPLRDLQRTILRRLLAKLRSHDAACGFEKGKSIVANARPHVGRAVVIKMDIVDFFPSISAMRIEAYFRRIGWNREAAALLTRLCTHEGALPQGAPTSPRLSNLLHFGFDSRLTRRLARHDGSYTRYADDITLSLPRDVPKRVRGLVQYTRRLAKVYGLRIHLRGKLRILRRHQQQRVTGLVVNEKVALPRQVRRWLRAVAHRLRQGRAATLTPQQLAGWEALRRMVAAEEPSKE
jgi:retron-type reverse transcriptase